MAKIEICAVGLNSALIAEKAGAHRIEFCENLEAGGLTPSYGLLKMVRNLVSIPIHVLIRPRRGDYVYDNKLIDVMVEDVLMVKSMGFEGVVIGVLDKNADLDIDRFNVLMEAAKGLSVTFHRAIDVAADKMKLIAQLIELNVDRVLTSGGQISAWEGRTAIAAMQQQFGSNIKIMAGSGIHSANVVRLLQETGVEEVHFSAKENIFSTMIRENAIQSGTSESLFDDNWWLQSDEEEIRNVVKLIS
jgi:copper homeostasis protein